MYGFCKDHNIILNYILVFPNLNNGLVKINIVRGKLYIWGDQDLHELTRFIIPLKIKSLVQIRPTQ